MPARRTCQQHLAADARAIPACQAVERACLPAPWMAALRSYRHRREGSVAAAADEVDGWARGAAQRALWARGPRTALPEAESREAERVPPASGTVEVALRAELGAKAVGSGDFCSHIDPCDVCRAEQEARSLGKARSPAWSRPKAGECEGRSRSDTSTLDR